MSRHGSYRPTSSKKGGSRSVLTRKERIEQMRKLGVWGDRNSALHLPKTRV